MLSVILVVVAAAAVLVPGLFLVYRSIGKSLDWRFRPGLTRLTTLAGMEQHPRLDSRGDRVVFEAIPDHLTGIYLLDSRTRKVSLISSPGINCRRPGISPDGRLAWYERVLTRVPARRSVIVVVDLETRTEVELGRDLDFVLDCSLSRDGRWALVSGRSQGRHVVRLHQDLEPRGRDLLPPGVEGEAAVISADGGRALLLVRQDQGLIPALLDLGDLSLELFPDLGPCRSFSMTPEGTRGVFEKATEQGSVMMLADFVANTITDAGHGLDPVISQDGSRVFFDRIKDDFQLWSLEIETREVRLLERGSPYPSRTAVCSEPDRLWFCSGLYNPLSRTGDYDIFTLDLTRARPRQVEHVDLEPRPLVRVSAQPSPEPGSGPFPSNSLWVAAYYFQSDGIRTELETQDGHHINEYSARLARAIQRVCDLTGAPRINLVCHCMGGLVAKGALQYFHDGELGYRGTDGVPAHARVGRLVTLASPLRGNNFFGLLPLIKRLGINYCRPGYRTQAGDMVRGSEFLARLNLGERWQDRTLAGTAACYKPRGRTEPPFYYSFTSDSYWFMDGGVEVTASRCDGIPGSSTHLADDRFALMYQTPEGRCSFERGSRLVHVPEDVRGDFVAEDKARALADYLESEFEPDVPILFVHGSYLFRGMAELSWLAMLRRLGGHLPDSCGKRTFVTHSREGEPMFWLLDHGW